MIFPSGSVAGGTEHFWNYDVDKNIPAYNNVDNIRQNEVLDFADLYLVELVRSYGNIENEKFVEELIDIQVLMKQIRNLNNIEQDVISTQLVINDLNKKISANNARIKSLKEIVL